MDIVRTNIDVLVSTGLGPRAEEDFLLARDTCVALLKLGQTHKVCELLLPTELWCWWCLEQMLILVSHYFLNCETSLFHDSLFCIFLVVLGGFVSFFLLGGGEGDIWWIFISIFWYLQNNLIGKKRVSMYFYWCFTYNSYTWLNFVSLSVFHVETRLQCNRTIPTSSQAHDIWTAHRNTSIRFVRR